MNVQFNMQKKTVTRLAALFLTTVILVGCDSKEKKLGQSLVKVNGEEVTIHQLNGELAALGATGNVPAESKKVMLEALIDRELFQQEAVKTKLDRSPEVLRALERAKSQILVQAYMQSKLAAIKPSKAEIEDYQRKHPELFSQRKLFKGQDIAIASKDLIGDVKSAIDAGKSFSDMKILLDSKGIKYQVLKSARTTADLPMDIVSKWQGLQAGQVAIVPQEPRSILVFIEEVKDAPVSGDQALSQIENFLMVTRRQEMAKAESTRLRAISKIEFLPAGQSIISGVSSTAAGENADQTKPVEKNDKSVLERGAAGLK